jgi:calcineurin-like phosphoesterase family protein
MIRNTYFWADNHIGHTNVYNFIGKDSERMRPFRNMYECEKVMVDNYNAIVKDDDIVYFLGDVLLDKSRAFILSDMKKGSKHLILGNHDNKEDVSFYRQYFDKIYGVLYKPKIKCILSHIPVHPYFLGPQKYLNNAVRFEYNIQGHTHDSHVLENTGRKDLRYLNCCVETTNYKPVILEELKEINQKIFNEGW